MEMTGSGRQIEEAEVNCDLAQQSRGEKGLPPEPSCSLDRSLGAKVLCANPMHLLWPFFWGRGENECMRECTHM